MRSRRSRSRRIRLFSSAASSKYGMVRLNRQSWTGAPADIAARTSWRMCVIAARLRARPTPLQGEDNYSSYPETDGATTSTSRIELEQGLMSPAREVERCPCASVPSRTPASALQASWVPVKSGAREYETGFSDPPARSSRIRCGAMSAFAPSRSFYFSARAPYAGVCGDGVARGGPVFKERMNFDAQRTC